MAPIERPFGSWHSPISTEYITAQSVRLGEVFLEGEQTYWLEGRSTEKGRVVLVQRGPDGEHLDLTPPPYNVRTRVQEYGGGAYTVHDGVAFFVNYADQRIYQVRPGGQPEAVTPESDLRFADLQVMPDGQSIILVVEDHSDSGKEAVNSICRLDLHTGALAALFAGNDFYASLRPSPDGKKLAWVTWNHPNMPWDDTELWTADLTPDGLPQGAFKLAGSPGESIMQPCWGQDGSLLFISDRTNWWNLYRWQEGRVSQVADLEAEFGSPAWVFGMSTYAQPSPGRVFAAVTRDGAWQMLDMDLHSGSWQPVELPFEQLKSVQAAGRRLVFLGGRPGGPPEIAQLDTETRSLTTVKSAFELDIDPGYLSLPKPLSFPTENGKIAHAFYYAPQNKDFRAPEGERPPLLVYIHGGPTSAASSSLDLRIQFWTSRGFAVVDVNYGGSTGFGREYRQRLYGRWGLVDVDDCANAALYLAGQGLVDRDRMAIRGGSAGGFTTLAALTFRDVFNAGASLYGLSDLSALATDTHKFESRYMDQLVGPYPREAAIYEQRSPLFHADRLNTPVIFFQGLEDRVVPPNQAEMLFEALRKKGVPVAYVPFEGEGHGFRMAENIRRVLESEYYFYARIFGIEMADEIEPVGIFNFE